MKGYNIDYLPSAKQDFSNIVLTLKARYPTTAQFRYDNLYDGIHLLENNPLLGKKYKSNVSNLSYRKLIVNEWLVFYVVNDDTIDIHAIINGKTDYKI